jgi:hypothetical protein
LSLYFHQSFANVVTLPPVFKFNGITQLSEIPDDIKNRYQWRCVTRSQLDEDTNVFLSMYPFDVCEGVTCLVNIKIARKQQKNSMKSSTQMLERHSRANQNHGRRGGAFARSQSEQYSTSIAYPGANLFYRLLSRLNVFLCFFIDLGSAIKRSFPTTPLVTKRFCADLNNSFPSTTNHNFTPVNNYHMNQYSHGPSGSYHNQNNHDNWSWRPPMAQQRQEFFERSNFELRSIASNDNHHYNGRPSQVIPVENNQQYQQAMSFNDERRTYNDPTLTRPFVKVNDCNYFLVQFNTHQR